MQGGPSKINPPNSHPSNPIHKAATAESKKTASTETQQAQPTAQKIEPTISETTPQHEINKTVVISGVVGLSALLFMAWRYTKSHHGKNKQPGVLGQKPDDLVRSFE